MLVSQPTSSNTSHIESTRTKSSPATQHFQRQHQADRFRPRAVSGDEVAAHAHLLQSLPLHYAAGSSLDSLVASPPSAGASPLSTQIDSDRASVLSQLETADALFDVSSLDSTEPALMPELWPDNFVPRSTGRSTHNRDASLSSFGSAAGPVSPYSRTSVNPRIAVNDSSLEDLVDLHAGADAMGQHQYTVKPYGGQHAEGLYAGLPLYSLPNADQSVSLMPPTGVAASSRRPRPISVASSIMSDSPATPSLGEEDDHSPHTAPTMATQIIPKLARTVTDAYGDELYSPNFHLTPSKQSPAAKVETYHGNDIFAQTLHAANNHHIGMHPAQAYHTSRGRSPFREGAPLAPALGNMVAARTSSDANQAATPSSRVSTDASRSGGGAYGLATAGGHPSEPNTPHTISPKDTFLDYHPEGDDDFTLFGPTAAPYPAADVSKLQQGTQSGALMPAEQARQPTTNFGFYPVGVPFEVQSRLPQQYPFVRQPQLQSPMAANAGRGVHQLANLRHPAQTTTSGLSNKPVGASADGGTYTCTYHGCSLRFETPALLQKHKREGHRQAHGLNSAGRRLDSNSTPGLFNTQSGPHKCDRINPTTGKPCNTIFSRPYDLTRHEDTIHNIRKLKVRCEICTEEKTFSRADALTRHFRVCHPGVEIPTKHRKRGSH